MQKNLVEHLKLENGDVVYKVNGRLTASSRDPKKEALCWIEGKEFFPNTLIVGAGSGYHLEILEEMQCHLDGLWVLEEHLELLEINRKRFPNLKFVQIENLRTSQDLFNQIQFFYIFKPAIQWSDSLYQDLMRIFRSHGHLQTNTPPAELTSILEEFVK